MFGINMLIIASPLSKDLKVSHVKYLWTGVWHLRTVTSLLPVVTASVYVSPWIVSCILLRNDKGTMIKHVLESFSQKLNMSWDSPHVCTSVCNMTMGTKRLLVYMNQHLFVHVITERERSREFCFMINQLWPAPPWISAVIWLIKNRGDSR